MSFVNVFKVILNTYLISSLSQIYIFFNREWNGDLKKLPNIKMRKVSAKGIDSTVSVASHNAQMEEENEENESCQNSDTNS